MKMENELHRRACLGGKGLKFKVIMEKENINILKTTGKDKTQTPLILISK